MYIDNELIDFLIGFFSATLLSGVIFFIFYRRKELEYEQVIYILRDIKERFNRLKLEKSMLEERIKYIKDLNSEFKNISNSLLLKTSKQNQEEIKDSIKPFFDDLEQFNKEIRRLYIDESKERFSLQKEIKSLKDLNKKLSDEANSLSKALKNDNKIAGNWGELILDRVLELSGLKEGVEYFKQLTLKGENSNSYRPDIIIKLPKNRDVVIDSKLSLNSYKRYINTNSSDSLKEFLNSIKKHINELSKKEYHNLNGINSLDFVILFIPIEGAFSLIFQKMEDLYEYAYKRNIILASPSTLITILKVIEYGWRVEYQDKNSQVIAKKASILYDKFKLFTHEMKKIESSLIKAQDSYTLAYKRLSEGRGNLIDLSKELISYQSAKESSSLKNLVKSEESKTPYTPKEIN